MNIRFELSSINKRSEALEYINEFERYQSDIHGVGGLDIKNYEVWVEKSLDSHQGIETRPNRVPASTYYVYNDANVLVGMINIRHYLNQFLITTGSGHVGYSVRPTQRRKGYAKAMLHQALLILKDDFKVTEALVGCYKHNIGSKKTIIANGGVLKEEILEENGFITLAFTIDLTVK